ncbi:MAG: hypothetical protein K6B65_04145 [Bacilli bacterium]|nr:hypothetical protein [Bacilli bacterium]
MHNVIFMSMVFVFAMTSFLRTYNLSTFRKAYLGLYKGVADNSVITISNIGKNLDKPLFYLPLFEKNVSDYLETELGGKLKYLYEVYVYDEETESKAEYGYKAEIDLRCRITDWRWITKIAIFVVQEGI